MFEGPYFFTFTMLYFSSLCHHWYWNILYRCLHLQIVLNRLSVASVTNSNATKSREMNMEQFSASWVIGKHGLNMSVGINREGAHTKNKGRKKIKRCAKDGFILIYLLGVWPKLQSPARFCMFYNVDYWLVQSNDGNAHFSKLSVSSVL